MSHLLELGYVRVEVPDPDALGTFLTEVIGLAPSAATASGEATWTDDQVVSRLIVAEGPAADVTHIGFEAVDAAAFGITVARLASAGFDVTDGPPTIAAERRAERVAAIAAPWGGSVELALGLERSAEPAATPLVPGGFLTAGQGFGHVVVGTTAFDEAVRLATEGLGLVQSDWLEMELAPGIDLEVRFFHGNARHHTLALARAPFELPQNLHHLMFETQELDDVGRAFDRAMASGLPIPNGLGRHDNDRMLSFYVASPAGFQVEIGHGARQVVEPWTDDRRYDRISAWGHQAVPSNGPTVT